MGRVYVLTGVLYGCLVGCALMYYATMFYEYPTDFEGFQYRRSGR